MSLDHLLCVSLCSEYSRHTLPLHSCNKSVRQVWSSHLMDDSAEAWGRALWEGVAEMRAEAILRLWAVAVTVPPRLVAVTVALCLVAVTVALRSMVNSYEPHLELSTLFPEASLMLQKDGPRLRTCSVSGMKAIGSVSE